MDDVSFACNALIPGRGSLVLRTFTKAVGNWIRGTVTLHDDRLRFGTTTLSSVFQETHQNLVIRYSEITACRLGRLAVFLKTVDVETSDGTVRFRCIYSWNETLLAEIMKRREENSPAVTGG